MSNQFLHMQKLAGLITESEYKIKLTEAENLSPEEQKVVDDILKSLNEGAFDNMLEKVKAYAKKGAITATILASLLATPNLSQAQQSQIKQAANIEMTSQTMDDATLGNALVKTYEANSKAAEQWQVKHKASSLVTNIKSVIKTGKNQQEIKDLGNIYQNNKDAQDFLKTVKALNEGTLRNKIKEIIHSSLGEAKKKKKDEPEDVAPQDDSVDLDMGAEETDVNPDMNMGTDTMAPDMSSEIDIDPKVKSIQDALSKALANAKALGDEKLVNQIGNTITMLVRTQVVGQQVTSK